MPQSVRPPSSQAARRTGNIALQVGLVVIVGGIAYAAIHNAAQNLAHSHIISGFGFWNNTAGFDISQTLIDYSASTSTFGRAFWVGLLNTLLVAGLGIVFATVLGFAIGIARLSRNWLVAHLAGGYVELIRNVPLLLQLLFWYNSVLRRCRWCAAAWRYPAAAFSTIAGCFCRGRKLPRASAMSSSRSLAAIAASIGFASMGSPPSGANRRAAADRLAGARLYRRRCRRHLLASRAHR